MKNTKQKSLMIASPAGQLGDRGGTERSCNQHAGTQQTGGHPAEEEEVAHEGLAQGERPPLWPGAAAIL